MTELATVSTKGQFVIPADIREALGIRPGTKIAVLREGNRIILEPVNKEYVRALRGCTSGGPSMTDALLKERREEDRRSKW
ncbi:MAG TPA: AbrB/MazE/SpoVT family DNA-binding domain-containing protein [Acidobacteriaceae bacterium]|jgi:AbrB family looped-hinge helix DNA binding protein|nr:AbrB/MazE/SpoVT family DNA-binding domain-containing protein [Acidobacteriaceae bacterium]